MAIAERGNVSSNQGLIDHPEPDSKRSDEEEEDLTSLSDVKLSEWITVVILCFVNLINYMDRFTIAGVLQDLQQFFQVGDDKGGLLQTAFVISYMIFAPLFGYLGDRYSRRAIMAFGVTLWSITTLLGSYMTSYNSFIFFRALVGIGEASYSTIAPTIISDMFVKGLRSKMIALFYFAIPVGSGLGYIIGSEMARMLGSWHWALRVTPFLGVIAVVLIVFCMGEPVRGAAEGRADCHVSSWREDVVHLFHNKSFMFSSAGFTCVAFVTGALAWWGPTYMLKGIQLQDGNENASISDVSLKFGTISMISGIVGVSLGSYLSARLRLSHPDGDPILCGFGLLISSFFIYIALSLVRHSTFFAYTFILFGQIGVNVVWPIVADIVSLLFGIVTMAAGLVGVPLSTILSSWLRARYERVDAMICAIGLFISAPLIILGMNLIKINVALSLVALFFAELTLNLNWAPVADILLYVVIPTRRSTAEAFQILFSHAFGDAGSPYLIGVISEALKIALSTTTSTVQNQTDVASNLTSFNSSMYELDVARYEKFENREVEFRSLQYALYITSFVEILGGFFFLITAVYVVHDRRRASQFDEDDKTESVRESSHVDSLTSSATNIVSA